MVTARLILVAVVLLTLLAHGRSGPEAQIDWLLLIDQTPSMKSPRDEERFRILAGLALELRRAFTVGPASRPIWRVGDRAYLFGIPGVLEGEHGQRPGAGRADYNSLFIGKYLVEYSYGHSRDPLYAPFEKALIEMTSLHPPRADQQGEASRKERGGAALSSTLRLLFLDGFLRLGEGRCVVTILYSDLEDYAHPLNPPLTPAEMERISSVTQLFAFSSLVANVPERKRFESILTYVSTGELRRKTFAQRCPKG